MNTIHKGKAKYISVLWVILSVMALEAVTAGMWYRTFHFTTLSSAIRDTVPDSAKVISKIGAEKIPGEDSNIFLPTVDTFHVKMSRDSLDAPVIYHADDSMVYDVASGKILLYGKKASSSYKDNLLTAPGIEYDQHTNLITASIMKDTLGKVISYPTFQQKDFKSISDTIRFNMKTGKGLTKGTYTQQGEMYVYGEKIKKVDNEVFYAKNGRFTTCNLDTPHFAFVSRKIKFRNNKFAITGPVHPEIEGIPLPLYLPFGIYPLSQGRHSGLIAPAFTANDQLGLALQGLGYYKVLNDYWDVTLKGTIYSYGGWTATASPRYYKRYHYTGNMIIDYQRFKYNFKGDPDYSSSKTFNIRWTHSMDSKARPGVSFSANVNAGSSKFNSLVPGNPMRNYSNQLSSTIQYAKIWKDKPFNISINASHNQNTVQRVINVTLPDLSFNVNTLYPFRRKDPVGQLKWYENIGFALNSNVRSMTSFSDDTAVDKRPIFSQISKNLQWGGTHNVPISLSLPQIGPFQVSPSVSYAEHWYQQKTFYSWDDTNRKLDTTINKGFYSARDMSFGVGVSTRIFGMFGFKKGAKVEAIRHEIRPSISVSYKPDLNSRFFYTTQVDTFGRKNRLSVFNGSLAGAFGEGVYGGIGFGIDNNLQMKVRNKKDTTAEGSKKITLLDGLSLSGSYNLLADSFQLSTLSLSARTSLFDKVNITAGATLDPYDVNAKGQRINTFLWKRKPISLGRMTSGNISLATQFQGGNDKKKKANANSGVNGQPYDMNTGMPLDEYQTELAYMNNNPGEFVDFSIPWSVNFSYSLRYTKTARTNAYGFENNLYQDINWNATLGLTAKWQLGINGFYNITTKDLGTISMFVSRDMHCWQMAINLSPVGRYRYFNITISPKSGLLRDLKINRSRYFYDL